MKKISADKISIQELKIDSLPVNTALLFEKILSTSFPKDFILIGGTAMSLQCGHRISEDLDFWSPDLSLEKTKLDDFLLNLASHGSSIKLVTPHSSIVKARINGLNLLNFARDYLIDNVRVTFMNRNDIAYQSFKKYLPIKIGSNGMRIMPMDGIFAMKSYVITQRNKSRDLLDLKYFLENGKSFEDICAAAEIAMPIHFSKEEIKSILIGNIPLDKNDEGIHAVQQAITIDEIYDFFKFEIDAHEQAVINSIKADYLVSHNFL